MNGALLRYRPFMLGTAQVATDEERVLLLRIARCPLVSAAHQGGQPCSEIVACQRVNDADRQVPEAWAGNLRDARVMFLSSNPSISEPGPGQPADAVEPFPTASSTDAEIVEFIGRRFDQTVLPAPWGHDERSLLHNGQYWPTPTRFWVSIRARARELLGDAADPAQNYVMTEVVHCKSRREAGVAAAAGICAQLYLDDIVRLSGAPVIAVVGKKAHSALTAFLPSLPVPPYLVSAELGGRSRTLVYLAHPSSWDKHRTLAALYGPEKLRQLRAVVAQGSHAGVCLLPPCSAPGLKSDRRRADRVLAARRAGPRAPDRPVPVIRSSLRKGRSWRSATSPADASSPPENASAVIPALR